MDKNIDIDTKGLKKQIIESGEYARIEIVVGSETRIAIPEIQLYNVGPIEMACLILAAESTIEKIKEKCPEVNEVIKNSETNIIEPEDNTWKEAEIEENE
jgi:hypothetical protein